jgi:hypothetical protein
MTMADNQFTAEDLSLLSGSGGDDGAGGQETTAAEPAKEPAKEAAAQSQQTREEPAAQPGKKATLAGGGSTEGEAQKAEASKGYWPEDWRQKTAERLAGGDKKAYERELRRLERIADPSGLYGMYRELEGKFTGGGLIKVPGKDASPEEIAAYHKALGVPEKPEDYMKTVKLDNGAVIGDADKPIVDGFALAMHKSGAHPAAVNAALNWYYAQQEERAAAQDEADDKFRREAEAALKEEFGPAFRRNTNSISSLFVQAPGGADADNEQSLFSRLMAGRMADGKIVGNDPDMVRFLVSLSREINPAATVVEDGDQSGKSVTEEISSIEKRMRDDRPGYFKDEAMQARYRELLDARERIRVRAR